MLEVEAEAVKVDCSLRYWKAARMFRGAYTSECGEDPGQGSVQGVRVWEGPGEWRRRVRLEDGTGG